MDNQQDQFGAPTPTNPGRTSQNSAATPGSSGAARKPVAGARSASAAATEGFGVSGHDTSHPNPERQDTGSQANGSEGTVLETALQSGKKWIEDSGVLSNVNQLPQGLKDFGNRAVARVSDLTTTQKVVGGALLAVGLGWLATRKSKSSASSSSYNYGKQRDAGYGRRSYGYQAPDAAPSRNAASGRSDSGAAYGNSSRYGNGGIFSGGATANEDTGANSGIQSGSGRANSGSGFGASAKTDHGARTSESSYRSKNEDFGSIE